MVPTWQPPRKTTTRAEAPPPSADLETFKCAQAEVGYPHTVEVHGCNEKQRRALNSARQWQLSRLGPVSQ